MDCLLSVYLMCLWLQQLNMIMLSSLTYKRIHTAQKYAQEEKLLPEYINGLQLYREVDAPLSAVLYRKKNIAMILLRHGRTDCWQIMFFLLKYVYKQLQMKGYATAAGMQLGTLFACVTAPAIQRKCRFWANKTTWVFQSKIQVKSVSSNWRKLRHQI